MYPDGAEDQISSCNMAIWLGPFVQHHSNQHIRNAGCCSHFRGVKIVNTNVLEAEQSKQLQAIRKHLDSLEDAGAQVIDV